MTYALTTYEVREAWVYWCDRDPYATVNAAEEFDAWLEQVRREAVDDAFQVYQAPDHEELDPEPWSVYCNGFPTFRRRATWAPSGDNGAGSYYASVFDPRPEYSQAIRNYQRETN